VPDDAHILKAADVLLPNGAWAWEDETRMPLARTGEKEESARWRAGILNS